MTRPPSSIEEAKAAKGSLTGLAVWPEKGAASLPPSTCPALATPGTLTFTFDRGWCSTRHGERDLLHVEIPCNVEVHTGRQSIGFGGWSVPVSVAKGLLSALRPGDEALVTVEPAETLHGVPRDLPAVAVTATLSIRRGKRTLAFGLGARVQPVDPWPVDPPAPESGG